MHKKDFLKARTISTEDERYDYFLEQSTKHYSVKLILDPGRDHIYISFLGDIILLTFEHVKFDKIGNKFIEEKTYEIIHFWEIVSMENFVNEQIFGNR